MHNSKTFDVVIIGSGLGGLLSAVMLAKSGMSVCVLEKNKQIGGCLQTFSFRKKVFDSCVHYIGGLGPNHSLHQIFKYTGIIDQLQLQSLDPQGFDRIGFGEDLSWYPQANGKEAFIEQLLLYFPNEQASLRRYLNAITDVCTRFPLYQLRKGSAEEKSAVTGWELKSKMEELVPNPQLRNVLLGNSLLYAGMADTTPFYLHALVQESYIHSAHKVLPGSSEISKLLWRQLQTHGGQIVRNAEVKNLVEEDGLVRYAITEDGERYYGRQFISNLHPQIMHGLLESNRLRPAYRKRIQHLRQTPSALMVNLVLAPGKVPFRAHNLYWHATNDALAAIHGGPDWPATLACFHTEDPNNQGFCETVSVLTYLDYESMQPWAESCNHAGKPCDRGNEYEDKKNRLADMVMEKLYHIHPDLRGAVLDRTIASPLTFRDYIASPEGSMYGIMKDVHKPSETTISVQTRIPNLLQTGQNVNLHGVLGVSITAVATCAQLLGMDYLLRKIRSA